MSERREILRRLEAARKGLFPHKTCGASRHVHLIVEGLLDPKSPMCRELSGYDPEHMAGSIASVLEGLWNARRWMRWEPLPPTKRYKHNGHWVPDLDAIAMARDSAETACPAPVPKDCQARAESIAQEQPLEPKD